MNSDLSQQKLRTENSRGMKKSIKTVLITIVCVLLVIAGIAVTALIIQRSRTDSINDDFSGVFSDEKYPEPVSVDGVDVITQDVSCGYTGFLHLTACFPQLTGYTVDKRRIN